MRVELVHISDLHIRAADSVTSEQTAAVIASIRGVIDPPCAVMLLITGDIAFSGKAEEYDVVRPFLQDVVAGLKRCDGVVSVDIQIVPGNHDCDFAAEKATRKLVIREIHNGSEWDPSVPALTTEVQTNFRTIRERLTGKHEAEDASELVRVTRFKFEDKVIAVWSINSAWMSQIREAPGALWFPVHQLQDELERSEGALNVLLMHHPLAWFQPETRRAFQTLIGNSFQIMFTGHEHLPEVSARNQLDGKETLQVEGGVFRGHGPDDRSSSFNVVRLNLDDSVARITTLVSPNSGAYEAKAERSWSFKATHVSKPYRLLNEEWLRTLNSAGATFRHPNKNGPLELDEIFVEPDLIDLQAARENNQLERVISAKSLVNEIAGDLFAVIGGPEKSGKSALLHWLYLQFHSCGLTPISIDGSSLPVNAIERLERLTEQEYLREYAAKTADVWKQLDRKSRAVLVDDLDSVSLNATGRRDFLDALKLKFGVVIVACDETLLFSASNAVDEFAGLVKYQLVEFGHRLRDQLIGKWIRIGRTTTLEESAFQLLREQRVRAINTLIGTNFVPSRPIFLLTLLQSMEGGIDAAVKGSSLGEYYEYLIRHALLGASVKPQDLDAVLNYLTELGYLLVCEDQATMSEAGLSAFDANFARRYALKMSFDALHKQLINADILVLFNGQVRFRYRYVLLFFGAKYLAKHFGRDSEIDAKVRALGQKLHVPRYADLMLFVVHHSNDPAVLDIILENARRVFEEHTPLRLDDSDMAPINALALEVPKLALKEEALEARRDRKLRSADAAVSRRREVAISNAQGLSLSKLKEQDIADALDYASEMSLSLRVLGILGQVLRNYYGSLLADRKAELAAESYALVGRVLRSVVTVIGQDTASVVSEVASALQKGGAQTQERAQALASRFVFGLSSFVIFAVIKRTSELVGSDKLMPTHDGVSATVNSPLSRMIRLAINLDYPGTNSSGAPVELPFDRIEELYEELKNSICASWILKRLVIDYLYMFEVSYQERQRVCERLGISVAKQRKIDLLSHRKRTDKTAVSAEKRDRKKKRRANKK